MQALVADRDPGYVGFNRALDAVRLIGSLAKPAVHLAALSRPEQFTLSTPVEDKAVDMTLPWAALAAAELRPQGPRHGGAARGPGEVTQPRHSEPGMQVDSGR